MIHDTSNLGKLCRVADALREIKPGLTATSLRLFLEVARRRGHPVLEIGEAAGLEAPGIISRHLSDLAHRDHRKLPGPDLISIAPGPDNRTKAVYLRPRGEALVTKLLGIIG